ncbi:11362_t:CDS:2 [Paraglomus occultum]|uniref:non-specific serine/threonine protein kinase n=1 Tax=Paraglomus occultum TaxID=144539 RepID=A0A9N9F6N4_9GLOM|nr:11362_t:CDS:2 [Paraglomus occultum]
MVTVFPSDIWAPGLDVNVRRIVSAENITSNNNNDVKKSKSIPVKINTTNISPAETITDTVLVESPTKDMPESSFSSDSARSPPSTLSASNTSTSSLASNHSTLINSSNNSISNGTSNSKKITHVLQNVTKLFSNHHHNNRPPSTPGASPPVTPNSEKGESDCIGDKKKLKVMLVPKLMEVTKTWKNEHGSKSLYDECSLAKKYGVCEKGCIGKGATAVVRLAHKLDNSDCEKTYAVKEFRRRCKSESERDYVKKLASEFCISSTLDHVNVVRTVDLVQDENHNWCEVMEYCAGGDLYTAIKAGHMTSVEINCCFKQLISGVAYLHSMGVAHRDIKPENLLLDGSGHLKITDFGVSDVFRTCWEECAHLSKGLCGSEPYIAPEQFATTEYDARLVDVWACGIVYYCMIYQGIPFRMACPNDPHYAAYLEARKTRSYEQIERLPRGCRDLLYQILEPDTTKRITIDEICMDLWFQEIEVCTNPPYMLLQEHQHICLKENGNGKL